MENLTIKEKEEEIQNLEFAFDNSKNEKISGIEQVRKFLQKVGYPFYLPAFAEKGYTSMKEIKTLDISDLNFIQVPHAKRIISKLAKISDLKGDRLDKIRIKEFKRMKMKIVKSDNLEYIEIKNLTEENLEFVLKEDLICSFRNQIDRSRFMLGKKLKENKVKNWAKIAVIEDIHKFELVKGFGYHSYYYKGMPLAASIFMEESFDEVEKLKSEGFEIIFEDPRIQKRYIIISERRSIEDEILMKSREQLEEELVCGICYECNILKSERVIFEKCGHETCSDCGNKLKNTCPFCNQKSKKIKAPPDIRISESIYSYIKKGENLERKLKERISKLEDERRYLKGKLVSHKMKSKEDKGFKNIKELEKVTIKKEVQVYDKVECKLDCKSQPELSKVKRENNQARFYASSGDLVKVIEVIKLGANDYQAILEAFCVAGCVEGIIYCINNFNVDINLGLRAAAKSGSFKSCEFLIKKFDLDIGSAMIEAGKNKNIITLFKNKLENNIVMSRPINELNRELRLNCQRPDLKRVVELLGEGANDINKGLICAISAGSVEISLLLISKGATTLEEGLEKVLKSKTYGMYFKLRTYCSKDFIEFWDLRLESK